MNRFAYYNLPFYKYYINLNAVKLINLIKININTFLGDTILSWYIPQLDDIKRISLHNDRHNIKIKIIIIKILFMISTILTL